MFCRFCGTNESQFRISGKFGCEHCATQFSYPNQKIRRIISASILNEIQTILTRSESKIWILSFRTRITRNLAHELFPYYDGKVETIKQLLVEEGFHHYLWDHGVLTTKEIKPDPLPKRGSFQNEIEPIYRLYLGSEDHLRLEILQRFDTNLTNIRNKTDKKQKEIPKEIRSLLRFLHQKRLWAQTKEIGFLSSCPTNLGKGRRDSVLLGIEPGIDPSFFSLFEKLSEFGIEFAPSSDHRRESLGNFRGLVVKISWKNAFAVQKRQFYKILGLRGSL